VDQVLLHRPAGRRYASLREITGVEEQTITNVTTADAIRLLQSLLVSSHDEAVSADEAGQLTPWERDRLLAALYTRIYGPRVDTTITCQSCEALFDLDFMLPTLIDDLAPQETLPYADEHTFVLRDDIRFRLPTGDDECAVFGLPREQAEAELLQRCVVDSEALDADILAEVQNAMQALAPVVNVDLDAKCPECGQQQTVQFDLQRYLLTALMNDRSQLVQEIHLLASAYGWSLSEILNLARSQRRAFVALVDADDALQKVRGLS
jgi:hypothetical protein